MDFFGQQNHDLPNCSEMVKKRKIRRLMSRSFFSQFFVKIHGQTFREDL